MKIKVKVDKSKLNQTLGRFALQIAKEVKLRTPVDTGIARNSVNVEKIKGGYIVGTNLNYWKYIEEGHGAFDLKPRYKKALYWKGAKNPYKKVRIPKQEGKFIFKGIVEDKELLLNLFKESIK